MGMKKESTYEMLVESHKEFWSLTFHSLLWPTVTDVYRLQMMQFTRIETKKLALLEMKTTVTLRILMT